LFDSCCNNKCSNNIYFTLRATVCVTEITFFTITGRQFLFSPLLRAVQFLFHIAPFQLSSLYKGSNSCRKRVFSTVVLSGFFIFFGPFLSYLYCAYSRRTFRRNFYNFELRYLSVPERMPLSYVNRFFFCLKIKGRNRFKSLSPPCALFFQHKTFAFSRVDNTRKRETQIGRRNSAIYSSSEVSALKSPMEKSSWPSSSEPERFP